MITNLGSPLAVVTGATAGLGLPLAIGLARAGWPLLLGARDADRAKRALAAVRAAVPGAQVQHRPLDLASLDSVRSFAAGLADVPIGLLVLNAGVMATTRRETQDGLELMMGTNAIGHAALAGLLLPGLAAAPGGRIVAQSSEVHRHARLDLDDLGSVRRFRPVPAYNASKLALHVLAVELDRRTPVHTVVANPGWVVSELGREIAATGGPAQRLVLGLGNRLIGQTPEEGARSGLHAALADQVAGAATGRYVAPRRLARLRGAPQETDADPRVLDPAVGEGLWRRVQELTGALPDAAAAPSGRA